MLCTRRYKDAMRAYKKGLELEPQNQGLQRGEKHGLFGRGRGVPQRLYGAGARGSAR